MTTIIGFDPGLLHTGWAIIQVFESEITCKECGLITTTTTSTTFPKNMQCINLLGNRLSIIHKKVKHILDSYHPDHAVIESIFLNKSVPSAFKLGQVQGIILALCSIFSIEISEYAANSIKKTITGYGHASKDQIKYMVYKIFGKENSQDKENNDNSNGEIGNLSDHEADALAIALTHAWKRYPIHW